MTWLTDARALLATTLNGCVFDAAAAGRVRPYPPYPGQVVRPSVWVGDHAGNISDGRAVATFQVFGVVDGELEAQDAMRDAILAAAVSGCQAVPGLRPVRWRTQTVPIEGAENPVERYRGFVLDVEVTATTRTFPAPVSVPAPIPPTTYAEV